VDSYLFSGLKVIDCAAELGDDVRVWQE